MADSKENTPKRESLGNDLARAREAKHVSKKVLAEEMHISLDVLERIEAGNWASFPVDAYVRAYLNSIASFLELDGNDVVARFDREKGLAPAAPEKTSVNSGSKSKKGLLFLILLLCIVVLAVLFRLNNVPKPETAVLPAPASDAETPVDSLPADSLFSVESPLVPDDSILEKVDSIASDLPKVTDSVSSSVTIFLSTDSGSEKNETKASPAKMQAVIYSSRLEFYGTDSTSSWIGIQKKMNDTRFAAEKILKKPNTFFEYGSNDTLYVTIGNRDGISKLVLNGKDIPLAKGSGKTTRITVHSGKIISGVH